MRSRLVLVIAAIAVIGGAGAAAARSTYAPTGSEARPRALKADYLIKAEFGMGYELVWSERSGSQSTPCSEWHFNSGTTELDVGSRGTLPGRLKVAQYPNYASLLLYAVGRDRGTFMRTLTQTGGTTACGTDPPVTFVPPANDCPQAPWNYQRRNAALKDATARGFRRLDQLTDIANSQPGFIAIAIADGPTGNVMYRTCVSSGYAPDFPQYVKLPVGESDIVALRKLKPGHRHRIQKIWGGPCKAADEIPPEAQCQFHLDLHVDIRRVRR